MKYYKEIDILKGIAIFLVILGHSIIVYPIDLHQNYCWSNIFDYISLIHMPLFFMISGFCFSYNKNYCSFIKKKVYRLVIPYIVFNLLEIMPRIVFPSLVNKQVNTKQFLMNMLLFGGNHWFLYVLFILFLFYPFLYKINDNKYLSLIFICITFAFKIFNPGISYFNIFQVINYLFYFNIGYVLRRHMSVFEYNTKNDTFYLFLSLIMSVCLFILFKNDNMITNELITLSGILCLYFVSKRDFLYRVFGYMGKYSLQLYLLNGFILVATRTIICQFTNIPIIIVSFNLLVDILVSYVLIKYIFIRNKILKLLCGL